MSEDLEFTIRQASVKDLEALSSFFIKAYGEKTVFQNHSFLTYYFKSFDDSNTPLGANIIAVDSDNQIISHYGGLHYVLNLDGESVSGFWGVNAFTLPEWRGRGINSKIVKILAENNDFNAVIGMPFEAPFFYKKYEYNIFEKQTLSRFLLVLSPSTFDIIEYLEQDINRARQLLTVNTSIPTDISSTKIVELNNNNFADFDLDMDIDVSATTHRSKSFLNWRVFQNPYIDYIVFAYVEKNKILAYIVVREEVLKPHDYKVARIIDLFGQEEGVKVLLEDIIGRASSRGSIYIDFSVFGNFYDETLIKTGFAKLEDDDCCLLPQVTAPVENRPNHEFIVIQSKTLKQKTDRLSQCSVYFTRIDGDRDRIAQISQIKELEHE